jgi:hypothetical protein
VDGSTPDVDRKELDVDMEEDRRGDGGEQDQIVQ